MNELQTSSIDRARLMAAGELVAAITHDLRQPLTALEMNVAAALLLIDRDRGRDGLPSETLDQVRSALRDALGEQQRMREALQAMEDLAVHREPAVTPVDLAQSVRDVIHLIAGDAATAHLSIELTAEDALPRVLADPVLVRQAVLNILLDAVHAVKHTDRVVSADVRQGDSSVTVRIHYHKDAGSPLPDQWTLALARSVVELHGGSLHLDIEPDGLMTVASIWPINGAQAATGMGPSTF